MTAQGTDISEAINDVAGDYAEAYLGVLIAESNLNEQALREGKWPDYSAGLSQVIAANLGYGTYQREATPEEKEAYQEIMFVPLNAILIGWTYYEAALKRMDYDPLWAALSYNRGPNYSKAQLEEQVRDLAAIRSRFERYQQSLEQARSYAVAQDDAVNASQEIKDKLHAAGDYALMASTFKNVDNSDQMAECVQGTKGWYISSPVDGWTLHGPFAVGE